MDQIEQKPTQTLSDLGGHGPAMTDYGGPGLTMADNGGQRPPAEERKEEHNITSKEAQKIFEQCGLLRSQRSIARYCEASKLDCYLDPLEHRYYITRASIDSLIGEQKEIQARHTQTDFIEPEHTTPDNDRQGKTEPKEKEQEPNNNQKDQIKKLKQKILDLKITNKGKDYFIDQLKNEREGLLTKVEDSARLIGKLETELRQIEAPKESLAKDGESANIIDIEDIEIPTKEEQEQESERVDDPEKNQQETEDQIKHNQASQVERHNI